MQSDQTTPITEVSKQPLPFKFSIELFAVLVYIALFAVISRNGVLTELELRWWTDIAWTIAALATGLKCFSAASLTHRNHQVAWRLVGIACLSWFVGMLIWDYQELIAGELTPFPALSDIGFLAFAPLFMAAFVSFRQQSQNHTFTWIQISKLGILATSIIIGHLIVFLEPIKQVNATAFYATATIAYPVIYMATLFYGIICLWHCFDDRIPRGFPLLLFGFAVHAVVDTFYAYSLLGQNYQVGNYLDIFWLIGFAAIYSAAMINRLHNDSSSIEEKPIQPVANKLFNFEALIPVISVFVVLIISYLYRHHLTYDTLFTLFPFAFLLIIFIAIGEIASQLYQDSIRAQLASSQIQLSSVLSTIPHGVQEIDTKGNILFSNEAHDQLFGYTPGELEGRHISIFFADPKDGEEITPYLSYLVEHKPQPSPFFAKDKKKDGTPILVQID